jgi:signal transduction histidine kinase
MSVRALLVLGVMTVMPLIVASVGALRSEHDPDVTARALMTETRALARELEHAQEADLQRVLRGAQARAGGRYHLLARDGAVTATLGQSHRPNLIERAQAFLFGDDELPAAEALGDVRQRQALSDSFALARDRGEHAECRPAAEGRQLRCHAVAACGAHFLLVERAERRTVGALVEQRYQLLRLSFFLLPWALLTGAWLAWRMIRPVETLRRQVDQRAQMSVPTADLPVTRKDEVGALAHAFNRLATRLSDRSREHEAFVADLAHEFKSPVAALRSAADKLSEGQHDPARLERLTRVIVDSSDRLQRALDAFLELAHAEAGWRSSDYEEVDLVSLSAALVQASEVEAAEALARARDAGLSCTDAGAGKRFALTCDASELIVLGVPDRLEAALQNLIENAAAFARERVSVRLSATPDEVRVAITDDGPGVAAADHSAVFERFFTRRSGAGGTGLGLALVRAIVEAHGGRVWVESTLGQGATFHVSLPRP